MPLCAILYQEEKISACEGTRLLAIKADDADQKRSKLRATAALHQNSTREDDLLSTVDYSSSFKACVQYRYWPCFRRLCVMHFNGHSELEISGRQGISPRCLRPHHV